MNAPRRLTLIAGAALSALALTAGPALAGPAFAGAPSEASVAGEVLAVEDAEVEDDTDDPAPATSDDGDHRIGLVDTPRDRFGLIMWTLLFVGGGAAFLNARRQLKGEREQATGEFRWR